MIHNIINNKVYIGETRDCKKRWAKHINIAREARNDEKFYIHRAIKKYGQENFVFNKIQTVTESERIAAERYWISFFNSKNNKYGYNLTDGGEGVPGRIMSEKTKEKIRKAAIGRTHTPETITKMSGDNNHGAKLKAEDVMLIRELYSSELYTLRALAIKFNVSEINIRHIVRGRTWRDVGGPITTKRIYPEEYRKTRSGENCNFSKLTKEKVLKIRELYATKEYSCRKLAEMFDIHKKYVSDITTKKRWKHI